MRFASNVSRSLIHPETVCKVLFVYKLQNNHFPGPVLENVEESAASIALFALLLYYITSNVACLADRTSIKCFGYMFSITRPSLCRITERRVHPSLTFFRPVRAHKSRMTGRIETSNLEKTFLLRVTNILNWSKSKSHPGPLTATH